MLISARDDQKDLLNYKRVRSRAGVSNGKRSRFEVVPGTISSSPELASLLTGCEVSYGISREAGGYPPALIYVAEVRPESLASRPDSLVAELWRECLGDQPVPFDSYARAELIEKGRRHSGLHRHIAAWEKLKAAGSPWVNP